MILTGKIGAFCATFKWANLSNMFFENCFENPNPKNLDFQKTSQIRSFYLSKVVALGLKNATKKRQVARNF